MAGLTDTCPDFRGTENATATFVARAALGVFFAANLVGVWMAALLVWPEMGRWTTPLTYGRWAPVHMDLQLYGWCSLPAIGVLLHRALPDHSRARFCARLAIAVWVGALAAGAISWLAGGASGRLFLNWSGTSRVAFIVAQLLLWSVLAAGWIQRGRRQAWRSTTWIAGTGMLALLVFVPVALWVASDPATYPPVNPASGGATGHSLLASTLGIIGIALVLPALLGVTQRKETRRNTWLFAAAYAVNWLIYVSIRHGHASNHQPDQILGLATLFVWPFLLTAWYRRHRWPNTARPWLIAAGAWALFLVIDGWVLFLPGVLESAKFGNALVAHSHLAMAGLLTCLSMTMLIVPLGETLPARALADRRHLLTWNFSCLLMVLILTAIGVLEARWAATGQRDLQLLRAGYAARLAAGVVMTSVSGFWLLGSLRAKFAVGSFFQPRTATCHEPVH